MGRASAVAAAAPADNRQRTGFCDMMYRLFYWTSLSLAAAWMIFAAYEAVKGF